MDEQKLKEMLSSLDAPEPSESALNQAVNSAMTAFDKKLHKRSQGFSASDRLTDIRNNVRRLFMEKKYVWSGVAGGVSVLALLAVLGTPFIEQQMAMIGGTEETDALVSVEMQKAKAVPGVDASFQASASNIVQAPSLMDKMSSALSDMSGSARSQAPSAAISPEYKKAVESANRQAAESAQVMGSSALPTPQGISAGAARMRMAAPSSMMPVTPILQEPGSPGYYQDEGRDKFDKPEQNAVKSVAAEPVSTFSIDVDTASYSFMRRMLNNGTLPQPDAVRVEELINYFDYSYPLPEKGADPFQPTVAVYKAPWNAEHKLVHIGIKGYAIETKPRSNLVFLIDTSGSMNSPDKLPLLVNSFKMMLDSLSPDDTVGLVVYAGSAGVVLEPTKVSEKQKIVTALENLSAGGSTAGAAGIQAAYQLAEAAFIKDGNNRVILATDGDFNVGVSDPDQLQKMIEQKREKGVSLSVLGFGQGNYNDAMMQQLAQNGNGNAAYIDSLNEARKVLVEEASSTLFTIAKDVKIQVEFNPALVSEYRLVGYETRHLNREDFNNDKVDAGEVGAGHTVTAIYEITPTGAAKSVDDLRYAEKKEVELTGAPKGGSEYAFLKIRYKQPDGDTSKLMTRPITPKDDVTLDAATDDIRFAAAVAGFGQMLTGGKYTGKLSYDDVIQMANNARGKDEFGYRTEFVSLVRLAKTLAAQ